MEALPSSQTSVSVSSAAVATSSGESTSPVDARVMRLFASRYG